MSRRHAALPPAVAVPWLTGAMATVAASLSAGLRGFGLVLLGAGVLVALRTGHPVIALCVGAAFASAILAARPMPPLSPGAVEFVGTTVTEVVDGPYGPWLLVAGDDGVVLVDLPGGVEAPPRGAQVSIEGVTDGEPGSVAGTSYRSAVRSAAVTIVRGPRGLMLIGHLIRQQVLEKLQPFDTGRALLAGFLIGDVSHLDEIDLQAMRVAGLSHFTAVSGSNVALFLTLVFVAAGPLSLGPRRRAVVGLSVLPVFAAVTGFEPSVMRASAMAATLLAGRLFGISLEAWQILATATVGLVILEPSILSSAGFQLSMAATIGVLVGARWPVRDGFLARSWAITVGAQLAVAPLLLLYFGKVPLVGPAVNLVAAPLVSAATFLGSLGVAGIGFLTPLGAAFAGMVMSLAHSAAGWPQIGWVGLLGVVVVLLLAWRLKTWRGLIALGAAFAIVVSGTLPKDHIATDEVAVLDIGQGDGILISGGDGHFAVVDGGPDPGLMLSKLRAYGITRLDLVVITHLHADHFAGIGGIVGRIPIALIWADPVLHATMQSDELFDTVEELGIPVMLPPVGYSTMIGGLRLTVLGPKRRYDGPNDQSIVILAQGHRRSMLLSGDIEAIAQKDLGPVHADVLKVPHHGGGTSDPDWLAEVGAGLAVISVGVNDFGHPEPWVISVLTDTGAEVLRTDVDGDVIVPLD